MESEYIISFKTNLVDYVGLYRYNTNLYYVALHRCSRLLLIFCFTESDVPVKIEEAIKISLFNYISFPIPGGWNYCDI